MLAQSSPGGRLKATERQRRAYRFWAPLYDEIYGGILRPAHRAIVELVSEDEGHVLEVGVGTGLLLPQYPAHLQVTGLDISEHMLARAHRKVQDHRLEHVALQMGDAQKLGFPSASFDVVVLPFVITLLPDPETALDECARVLNPKGSIIIASKISNGSGVQGAIERAIAPAVERIGWSATFRSQRLSRWVEGQGEFEVSEWRPVSPLGLFKVIKLTRRREVCKA
jgi:phosphatidylethanolamine/phosphatidyl-N-methylethanolamine N-methyltransferase